MADTSVKLRTFEGGVPNERDPIAFMAGILPQVPVVVRGQGTTVGAALANAQLIDATLTALAGVTVAADTLIYATGPDAFVTTPITAQARALLDDASQAAMQTTLGLGSAAVLTAGTAAGNVPVLDGGAKLPVALLPAIAISGVTGLQGTLDGKQPLDATLTALAGVTTTANKLIYATGSDVFATADLTSFARSILDDPDAPTVRATLGLSSTDSLTFKGLRTTGGGDVDYRHAQAAASGGGTVSWIGLRLKWTSRFFYGPISLASSPDGYVAAIMPTANIPAANVYSGVARSVTTDGVLLSDYEALYAEHTVGGAATAIAYRIIRYDTAFVAPPNWLLVAAYFADDSTLKLGTGQILRSGESQSASVDQFAGSIAADASYAIQRFPSGQAEIKGSSVVTLDANGRAVINVGLTAAAGTWVAIACNGDFGVSKSQVISGLYTSTGFTAEFQGIANTTVRVNWLVWGRWK